MRVASVPDTNTTPAAGRATPARASVRSRPSPSPPVGVPGLRADAGPDADGADDGGPEPHEPRKDLADIRPPF